jgi:hypothetical protein
LKVQQTGIAFEDYNSSRNFSAPCSAIRHASVFNNNPGHLELYIITDNGEYKLTDDEAAGMVDRANAAINGIIPKCQSKPASVGG